MCYTKWSRANRLKRILLKFIFRNQSALSKICFLIGNVLLVSELVKSYHKTTVSSLCACCQDRHMQNVWLTSMVFLNDDSISQSFRKSLCFVLRNAYNSSPFLSSLMKNHQAILIALEVWDRTALFQHIYFSYASVLKIVE